MTKLTIDSDNGLVSLAHYCPSPNYDLRPDPSDISLLVIHNISLPPGEFGKGNIEDFFCNQLDQQKHPFFKEIEGVRVSAHLLIDREGEITQFVPFQFRAWHAGKSCFAERDCCNDFSIGIELEGTDTLPYSDAQYQTLAKVTRLITLHYPAITKERIVGHQQIAPERKTDPGPAFDWPYFHKQVYNA